jgi:hypothetical protein
MPWLTLDYKELSDRCNVTGILKWILFDGNMGDIICVDTRDQIQLEDKKGNNVPWISTGKNYSDHCILL